ncbi:hypothetical protein EK904_003240, partial [Melospiza melodia maxima]
MYMRRWLHERFEIKDKPRLDKNTVNPKIPTFTGETRLLIEFYDAKDSKRRNKFPGKSVHSKLSLKKTLPSLLFLGGLTASMLLTESGRKLYSITEELQFHLKIIQYNFQFAVLCPSIMDFVTGVIYI